MEENERKLFDDKRLGGKKLLGPIVAIALITGVAVWLVPDDKEGDGDKIKPLPRLGSVVRPLDSPGSSTGPAERNQDAKSARSIIAELRSDGKSSGQNAFEEAEKQRKNGQIADAYLLYFFAARRGHGEAALVLGTQADPAFFSAADSTLDAPDPSQAVKWYKLAIDAGNDEAKRRLQALRSHVQEQARNGSDEARRLMLQLR